MGAGAFPLGSQRALPGWLSLVQRAVPEVSDWERVVEQGQGSKGRDADKSRVSQVYYFCSHWTLSVEMLTRWYFVAEVKDCSELSENEGKMTLFQKCGLQIPNHGNLNVLYHSMAGHFRTLEGGYAGIDSTPASNVPIVSKGRRVGAGPGLGCNKLRVKRAWNLPVPPKSWVLSDFSWRDVKKKCLFIPDKRGIDRSKKGFPPGPDWRTKEFTREFARAWAAQRRPQHWHV